MNRRSRSQDRFNALTFNKEIKWLCDITIEQLELQTKIIHVFRFVYKWKKNLFQFCLFWSCKIFIKYTNSSPHHISHPHYISVWICSEINTIRRHLYLYTRCYGAKECYLIKLAYWKEKKKFNFIDSNVVNNLPF